MRWRTKAAEEMRQTVGGRGATTMPKKTTKNNNQQMCGGRCRGRVRRQRQKTTTAGKRRDAVVEAEEQLLYGVRGEKTMEDGAEVEDGRGSVGRGVHFFSFRGGVESYL
jgi:hypothetical protein